jgi:uncharacterized protein DUF4031
VIYVDDAVWPGKGRAASRMWAHLVSDLSFDELHAFAQRLGVPGRGFERDHYDIPAEMVATAVARGARYVRSREIVEVLRRSGLRRPKHEAR